MKIRADFITNSSSVAFVLSFKPIKLMLIDEFRDNINSLLEIYMYQTEHFSGDGLDQLRFWDASRISIDPGTDTFVISESVTRYNCQFDIPKYIRFILIRDRVEGFEEFGFKLHSFEIKYESYKP